MFFKGVINIPHLFKSVMIMTEVLKVVSIFMKDGPNHPFNIGAIVPKNNKGVVTIRIPTADLVLTFGLSKNLELKCLLPPWLSFPTMDLHKFNYFTHNLS